MAITKVYKPNKSFQTESGELINDIHIAYTTLGKMNPQRSNVIWVCHAFTADSNPHVWWPGMVGKDTLFSPKDYFIVCANILGSPYGTTSPTSINPNTNRPYHRNFPPISVRDIVAAHILLADFLQIDSIHTLIGGSIGGFQVLEWAIIQPNRIANLVVIASSAESSTWRRAHNATQRMIIEADASFYEDSPNGGRSGMMAARAMSLLSYRNAEVYALTQREETLNKTSDFKVESYQRYQGEKLAKRFNAYSYYTLLKMLDTHDIGRNRGGSSKALHLIQAKTLIIGIESDILFWPEEQTFLNTNIPDSNLEMIQSLYGHDGFLLENEKISAAIAAFLKLN